MDPFADRWSWHEETAASSRIIVVTLPRRVMMVLIVACVAAGLLGGWIAAGAFTHGRLDIVDSAALPQVYAANGAVTDGRAAYAAATKSVLRIDAPFGGQSLQGTGFLADRAGHIITAAHVLHTKQQTAQRVWVETMTGERLTASLVGLDLQTDVAVLRIDGAVPRSLQPVAFASSNDVSVGMPIAVLGSPQGHDNSLSVGVVSQRRRMIPSVTSHWDVPDVVQFDASVNHGTSGAPLLALNGAVLGLVVQISTEQGDYDGIAFAVGADTVRRIADQIVRRGQASHAWLGIQSQALQPGLARKLDLPADLQQGLVAQGVDAGSPAGIAGIRAAGETVLWGGEPVIRGDILLKLDQHTLSTSEQLARLLMLSYEPGQEAKLEVYRDGHRRKITVTLGSRNT